VSLADATKEIEEQLGGGETIQVVIKGVGDEFIFGTDRRVFVWKKGLIAGARSLRKLATWDYRNITGVHMDTGVASGIVVIQAAGIDAGIVKYHSSNKREDAFSLPHAIPTRRVDAKQVGEGVAKLRSLISAAQRASVTGGDSPS